MSDFNICWEWNDICHINFIELSLATCVQRKLERELAYYDGGPPSNGTELDENNELLENDEETEPRISTSGKFNCFKLR